MTNITDNKIAEIFLTSGKRIIYWVIFEDYEDFASASIKEVKRAIKKKGELVQGITLIRDDYEQSEIGESEWAWKREHINLDEWISDFNWKLKNNQ